VTYSPGELLTLGSHTGVPIYSAVDYGAVGDNSTDNSAAFQALADTLETSSTNYGAVIALSPGIYRCYSEVDWYNIPSLKFVALAGKPYQGLGTTAKPVNQGGVAISGMTSGMTVFKCDRPNDATYATGNTDATHNGPSFEGIGFRDGLVVASRVPVTAVALASGTTYTYTTSAAHGFIAGDHILVNGIHNSAAPYGNAFNGHVTVVAAPTSTTFTVNVGSNPSTTGLDFSLPAEARYAPTMTLLDIEHMTRARLRDCHFAFGLYGIKWAGANDVSWANLNGCSFLANDTGLYYDGTQAQSAAIQGGDFQYGTGQIGVDYVGSRAMFKMRDFKMDSLYNDGTGAIGIRLQQAQHYTIDGSFEIDGPSIGIQVGTAGNSYGRISSSFQGGSTHGTKGSRVGTAIQITGTSAGTTSTNTDTAEVSIVGSTFSGFGKAVDLANSRGAKIIGGSQALCDIGVNIASTCQGTIVAFFTRRVVESGGDTTAAGHITDAGVGTKRIFCDNVNEDGGIVPGPGATTMTAGFMRISAGAGAPSGTPATLYTGTVPLYYDTTNHFLYVYDGGWKKTTVFA